MKLGIARVVVVFLSLALSSLPRVFCSDTSANTAGRTGRTEVTVQREAATLLVGGATAGFDTCPLCGRKLAPEQAARARLRLPKGSISQGSSPVDHAPP
ncbi:MAG: hypothetical protein ABSE40_05475 [Candidatus Sulfotelmatobacter sp.]